MITFGIIARQRIPELDDLISSLLAIDGPSEREVVVGVETHGASCPEETVDDHGVRWIALPARRGLGYNRNMVLAAARGHIMVGIDDDCEPGPGWLRALIGAMDDPLVDAAVGRVEIPPSGFVGDSISALGFPAGGSAGYETMFTVHPDGSTDNISTLNCALRVKVVRDLGGFDESLTYGGEDTELAHRLRAGGGRIVYVPDALLVHPARTSLGEFARWFYVRGRAKRQFARRVPVSGYVGARLTSYGRIVRDHLTDPKIVLIVPLLVTSIVLQQAGFIAESVSPTSAPAGTSMPEPGDDATC